MDHLFTFLRRGNVPGLFRRHHASSITSTNQTTSVPPVASDPLPGRDLMFAMLREHLTMQHQVADQQDTKAAGIVVGGTTMVGFVFLVQHRPLGYCTTLFPVWLLWLHHLPIPIKLGLPYCPFLACYLGSIIFALLASRIRGYWTVPQPVKALKSMNTPEQKLKEELSAAIGHFSVENQTILDAKARWLRWAVRFLLAQTLTLVFLLMYQTVC